jgi:VIT1/CCC1 family predicted Fe2+/Mn2+ transporter
LNPIGDYIDQINPFLFSATLINQFVSLQCSEVVFMARNVKKDECCCNGKCPFMAIPSALAGIFLVLAVLFLLFAKDQLALLIPLVWAFVVLGILAMLFALRAMKK